MRLASALALAAASPQPCTVRLAAALHRAPPQAETHVAPPLTLVTQFEDVLTHRLLTLQAWE